MVTSVEPGLLKPVTGSTWKNFVELKIILSWLGSFSKKKKNKKLFILYWGIAD